MCATSFDALAARVGAGAMASFDVDDMEEQAALLEFAKAVEFCGTQPVRLSEAVQRRLYGLHCVATRGRAPKVPPPQTLVSEETKQQYDAWKEASEANESSTEAMLEYVDLVTANCPAFGEEDDAADGDQTTLDKLKDQLAGAGFREAGGGGGGGGPETVFEAARDGAAALAPFLPGEASAVDEDGLTVLLHAVDAEQLEAVEALVDAGADVDDGDEDDNGPLHYAALLGAEGIAELLKERGASLTRTNADGMTPAEVAADEGHHDIADLLAAPNAKQAPTAQPADKVVGGRRVAPEKGKTGTTLPAKYLEKR